MIIPFELHEGLAVVDADVLGQRGKFVVDTGCGLTSIDSAWAASLGIDSGSPVDAHGAATVPASLATTSLRLGDLALDQQQVVLMPLDAVGKKFGFAIDGVIGFDILSRGIVDIDFRQRTLGISETAGTSGLAIPVDLTYRIPIATATIVTTPGVELTARMAIDLGSTRLDVRLLGPFVEQHRQHLDALELLPGAFGTGVGGDVDGHLTRFHEVRAGELTIARPTAAITTSRAGAMGLGLFDGTIGVTVFHDRRLILDYARNRVIVAS
jgi:hypothetical protein